jgi:hypothetical protein
VYPEICFSIGGDYFDLVLLIQRISYVHLEIVVAGYLFHAETGSIKGARY